MPVKKIKNQKSKVALAGPAARHLAGTRTANPPTGGLRASKVSGSRHPLRAPRDLRSKMGSLKVDVYDLKGKVVESMELPKEMFGVKVNKVLISQAVRVYLANQRTGTASTKTRSEVKGSSRKIYKQKGTGRARHGSIRAPIFVKGGLAFGPKPRDYSLKLSKKMKRSALFSALSAKLKDQEIKIIKGLKTLEPKTKNMANTLKNLELSGKKIMLVLPKDAENIMRAVRNIENTSFILVNTINTYQILNNKVLIFAKEALEEAKDYFLKEK
ncbi:MAG: 50S ribosomal protein L4 [Candidatus Levyibacteriota bacterium]